MRPEIQTIVDEIKQALSLLRRHLDWDVALKRLDELNARAEDPNLWNDPAVAQKLMRERDQIAKSVDVVRGIGRELDDHLTLLELGEAENDEATIVEAEEQLKHLGQDVQRRQIEALLSGEADSFDTYVEFHAGAGGTESQDWAEMLMRMYMRWAEQHDYKVEIIEYTAGEGAGIKGSTLLVKGPNAYGWLKTESGVHRLVRISPFDANARRQTSFASVWVYPVIDDSIEITIPESDVRVDTYRSSGAGGQHVNTTDSAVRLTHIPTGIAVACQAERSQHKNRAKAWDMLRARLYEVELKKREEKASAEAAAKTEIGWGHQIRSYVLQPYQMVKDLRTGVQSTDPAKVLNGDLDPFMEASLAARVSGGAVDAVADIE
ncbi:peptide chain release factor 2 [Prosthecodimorpha staleyi]|uniref:Peptide chain release factor 2 n=1 Tax=Prosthecodimorpha staleyi TaxID=2840188 RepID=A0A947D8C0_9HYPH|nr:peptide chain release factor 2 [Prosthecodimorpha staleyi]MBT9292253.1 peptide chain release factor 2 [Prosthecodimorpha staleyi]